MVAVVIVAIVAAVALPAYTSYVTRARLSDAYDGLTNYRLRMEQAYQDTGNFHGACWLVCHGTTHNGLSY